MNKKEEDLTKFKPSKESEREEGNEKKEKEEKQEKIDNYDEQEPDFLSDEEDLLEFFEQIDYRLEPTDPPTPEPEPNLPSGADLPVGGLAHQSQEKGPTTSEMLEKVASKLKVLPKDYPEEIERRALLSPIAGRDDVATPPARQGPPKAKKPRVEEPDKDQPSSSKDDF